MFQQKSFDSKQDKIVKALESDYEFKIATRGVELTPPNPERTKDAFARIGYSLEESVADLIDNSLDAGATDVLIRFIYDRKNVHRIFIVDNGRGMREERLRRAMQFGSTLEHEKTDLGKYGIGLKSASLSQCKQFAVISRVGKEVCGRRWSSTSFQKDWLCEKLDPSGCSVLVAAPWDGLDVSKSCTIVMWEQLTCLQVGDAGTSETVNRAIIGLANHLGLVFHRFLEKKGKLKLHLDSQFAGQRESGVTQIVEPFNPFGYPVSGVKTYPKKFEIKLAAVGRLTLVAHIWPPKSKDRGYTLGGGKISSRQGFYFYRNDRLIQAGGWNGYRGDDSEPHVSLARVAVDIPLGTEGHFDVMVQKSKVSPPRDFVSAVKSAVSGTTKFSDFVSKAIEVYRKKLGSQESDDFPLVPWGGLSLRSRDKAKALLAPDERKIRKVGFRWKKLDATTVFDLDRERRLIYLNEIHRKAILGGARRSKNDAELFKAAIFLLVQEHFDHQAITRGRKKYLVTCNRLLLDNLSN